MNFQLISVVALILSGVVFLWNIVLTGVILKQRQFLSSFTKGVSKKDLHSVLKNIAYSLKTAGTEIEAIHEKIADLEATNRVHLQKIGFIRYNPFSDTGGDQSFCLCLLDQNNSGIVITSLHSREQTRIYGKRIASGKAESGELSREEAEAVAVALKANQKKS